MGPVELVSLPAFLHLHYQACSCSGQVRGGTDFHMCMPAGPALLHPQCHGVEGQGQLTHTQAIVASSPALPQRGAGLAGRGWLSHTSPVVPVLPQPHHQDQVSCAAHARGRTGSPTFMQYVPTLPSPYHLWYHHDVVAYWEWSQLRAALGHQHGFRVQYRSQTFS